MGALPIHAGGAGGAVAEAVSVSELTARIKQVLATAVGACWVRGEVSNLRVQSSGHSYFSLKDAGAQIGAVLFRGDAARSRVALRDGLQVVVYGELSVYAARGNYQLVVRVVVEDGVGRLQQEFERLKRRLADEGLFAAERKKSLPAMPRTIGFVTSPTGAAVQDFIRILQRRGWTGRLVVLPAKVQGAEAAAEMVEMLALAQDADRCGVNFDLLVIGRGGGSLEDLWAFNEEALVRAVAACRLPIVSAVGHEIDFTLCDFAADVRAETPSAAAELISSRYLEWREGVAAAAAGLEAAAERVLAEARAAVTHAASRLRLLTPQAQIEQGWLRLDDVRNRIGAALRMAIARERRRVAAVAARFDRHSPEVRVRLQSQRLLGLWKRLQAASPASVLQRGFAIVRAEDGTPLERRAQVRGGAVVQAEFADGTARLRVEG